jgi:periplasmic divalent cation tolerance protein
VRSIYRWRGRVEEAPERLLVVKGRADRLDALAARIVALHPYEVPELLALPVARGLGPYLDWLRAEGG